MKGASEQLSMHMNEHIPTLKQIYNPKPNNPVTEDKVVLVKLSMTYLLVEAVSSAKINVYHEPCIMQLFVDLSECVCVHVWVCEREK